MAPNKKRRLHKCRECDWVEFTLFLTNFHFGYFCHNWNQEVLGSGHICNKVDFTKKGKKLRKEGNRWRLKPV